MWRHSSRQQAGIRGVEGIKSGSLTTLAAFLDVRTSNCISLAMSSWILCALSCSVVPSRRQRAMTASISARYLQKAFRQIVARRRLLLDQVLIILSYFLSVCFLFKQNQLDKQKLNPFSEIGRYWTSPMSSKCKKRSERMHANESDWWLNAKELASVNSTKFAKILLHADVWRCLLEDLLYSWSQVVHLTLVLCQRHLQVLKRQRPNIFNPSL